MKINEGAVHMPSRMNRMRYLVVVVTALGIAVASSTLSGGSVDPVNMSMATKTSAVTAASTTDGRIIEPNYQSASIVNVKDFGAHSIDEPGYENYDSTAAIQAAINSMETVSFTVVGKGNWTIPKGKLVIPAGNWNIPGGLTI